MWSPTKNTSTESDNKKKENVEGEGSSRSIDSSNLTHNIKQELNDFDRNSKKAQSHNIEEVQDSGFLSGEISSSVFDSSELKEQNTASPKTTTSEQIPKISSSNKQDSSTFKQQDYTSTLDSGCIVSENLDVDDDQDIQEIHQNQQQKQKQVLNESSSSNASNNPMIFKQKVDANISEWFCNLSLQSDQGQSTGLNNLNTALRSTNQSHQQQNPQQSQRTVASNKNQTQTQQQNSSQGSLNPSNAWERFYQQNDEGDTPLHIACAFGEEDVVAALIRMVPHPCLFNIQNDEGQTALHIAARANQPKVLRMLLIAGAEPVIRDCRGNTALHLACDGGEMQCVRALTMKITQSEINEAHRQYGHRSTDNTMSFLKFAQLPSDMEIRNYDGERCVHIAAQKGHLEILRVLELCGADMNAREGRSGYTPLHIAILNNNDEIISFLLNECKNLNLEAMSYAGRTAYQIADALEKYQMTNILKERGAEPLTPPDSDYDSSDLESDDEKEHDWFGDHHFFTNYTLLVA